MALDMEKDLAIHQPRFAKGNQPTAVGPMGNTVDRAQFDERHSTARLLIDYVDFEIFGGGESLDLKKQEQERAPITRHTWTRCPPDNRNAREIARGSCARLCQAPRGFRHSRNRRVPAGSCNGGRIRKLRRPRSPCAPACASCSDRS